MALWIIPTGIFAASILALVVYLIFKYAIPSKSYEEAMAEKRKLERNLRSKLKPNHPKKQKNQSKDDSQADKQTTKAVPLQTVSVKDTKKVEVLKNGPVASVDKVDGNTNGTKKKNDKVSAKSVPLSPPVNTAIILIESTSDNGGARVDDNSVKKKPSNAPKNDEGPPLNVKNVDDVSDATNNVEKEAVPKVKPSKANKISSPESGDGVTSKTTSLSDLHEKKKESKKNIPKSKSDENIAKSGLGKIMKNNADEKGTVKETKSKHNDGKPNRSQNKGTKHEESKGGEKMPSLSSKNKKTENNVAEGQTAVDTKDTVPVEQSSSKGVVPGKVEKSSSTLTAGKKSSNAVANSEIPHGKTNPAPGPSGQKSSNNVKSGKKATYGDMKALQKLSDEKNGPVNINLLMPLIAKAELSRSDYQNLIDLLLNKQLENSIDAEWIESGRQDPIAKLKKQLTEKEKALSDEQEAHQAIQSKVKELRAELNAEKYTNRQFEETLNTRQMDLQALNARLQSMAEEKQNYSKQLQLLQNKFKEERTVVNTLKDENSKTKSNLQHELLSQRQQLELHIAHLNEQHQQEVLTLETQLNQLASQLQEQGATNAHMTDEIRECVVIRERLVHQENQLAHLQQTLMQLEELRSIKADLERHVASSQFEVKRLTNELQTLTDQLNRRNSEIEKFNCTVQNMKIEHQELLIENSRVNEQMKFTYNEKTQLQMENEKLRDELRKLDDQYSSSEDVVRLRSELESYRNALADKNAEIKLLNEHVAVLKSSEQQVLRSSELQEGNESTNELRETLQKQMKKNEDLRGKNWKIMEALSSMEKILESKVKEMQRASREIKSKEREFVIEQLKNVLLVTADVNVSNITNDEVWSSQLQKILTEVRPVQQSPSLLASDEEAFVAKEVNVHMLDELEKQNKQLQGMVGHYKNIISDTEGMLNSLQNHVEREENRWSEQVLLLQAELNAITEERNSLLQKINIQNGCVPNDISSTEQVNGLDKLPSMVPSSSPTINTKVTS